MSSSSSNLPISVEVAGGVLSDDLALSGLHPSDIQARIIGTPERSALDIPHTIPGYLIPYFDIDGNPTPHYRARLFNFGQKYRQPKGKGNAIYFPQTFRQTLNGHPYLIITEGEKKAAAAARAGVPTVALGGVYSWRNKTITLPDTAVVTQKGVDKGRGAPIDLATGVAHGPSALQIKLPSEFDGDALLSDYAEGFQSLVNLVIDRNLTVFVAFDCLPNGALKTEIAKAAARFALELRFMGVPYLKIRSLPLPAPTDGTYLLDKVGLDDFIQANRQGTLEHLIDIALTSKRGTPEHSAFGFPLHPNMKDFVTRKLQGGRLPRREMGLVGLAITADLDSKGQRLRSRDGLMHYFDSGTHRLLRATSPMRQGPTILDDQFKTLLYRRYSLTQNDAKLLGWVTTQYTAEEPIESVEPRRNVFTKGDTLYYQINNSQFVKVHAGGFSFHYNGSEGTLFQSEVPAEAELPAAALEAAINRQLQCCQPIEPWWYDTLKQTRLKGVATNDPRLAVITTLLFYASPWLLRWRGTQLPVELVTGEAGSGKSTLYGLRQVVLQGREDLKNSPKDLQGWMASVLSIGGLHVTDNLSKDMDRAMKQALADEMSRLTTEPHPSVEMRRYYTEHELIKAPVHATFAITSLAIPFPQNDLIQRSLHIAFDKGAIHDISYDSDWASTQLARKGGRLEWVAHHLVVMHKFFQEVGRAWAPQRAQYRLINFEQICTTLAQIFGWNNWVPQIPTLLATMTQRTLSESDWVLEGIAAYTDHMRESITSLRGTAALDRTFLAAADIAQWCASQDDFVDCAPLTNPRRLSRYLSSHESTIVQLTGLRKAHSQGGKQYYLLGRAPGIQIKSK